MAPPLSYYDILGLSTTASPEQIKKAYRSKAFDLHPDRHVGASAAEIEALTEKMSAVSEAYEVLSDPSLRSEYDRRLRTGFSSNPHSAAPHARTPGLEECMFCGWGPAEIITLRQGVGMIITRRKGVVQGNACKLCAKSMFRHVQNATLMKGWWGLIAFFANIGYVLHNLGTLRSIAAMPEPSPPLEHLVTPLAHPMNPGRPLMKRAGIWVSIIAFIAAGVIVSNHNTGGSSSGSASPAGSTGVSGASGSTGSTGQRIAVGQCVTVSGTAITSFTSCSNNHYAKIIAITGSGSTCPSQTTNYFTEQSSAPNPGQVVCLDNLQ